jgi:phosphatidate cytidylyltransferase
VLKQRVVTAIILAVLFLAALFLLPALGWAILVAGIVTIAASEWGRLAGLAARGTMVYWGVSLVLMAGLLCSEADNFAQPVHLAFYTLSALLWLLLVPLWLVRGWQLRNPMLMALLGWAVLIPTGLAMVDLRTSSPWLLLGVMALVWMADIAAYFTGRSFGKHKLAPAISPGKTWEGVAGAVLGVSIYVALAALGSGLSARYALPVVIAMSWLWVALSVIGDLFESAIKRQAGVKDSGTLLPGHGGLLDRIDALTSTLPLAALVLLLQRMA